MDASRERAVRALEFFNAERAGRPDVPAWKLVDEAARRFDLDAGQSEWLLRTVLEAATPDRPTTCPTCGGALQPANGLDGTSTCGSGHLVRTPG